MNKVVSEDAVRRAFAAIDEDGGAVWVRRHLDYCTAPPWILDIDTTMKPLYGHQEGAVTGYNPKKPGRPSCSYHTYSMAGAGLVLNVDVVAGNEHSSKHFAPGLWALLDRIPRDLWPALCVPMPASAMSRSCAKNDGASGEDENCVRVTRILGPDGRVYVTRGLICQQQTKGLAL